MTKFKKFLICLIVLHSAAVFSLAHAQNVPGPGGLMPNKHPGQRIQEIYSQLNLTDDQKMKLETNKQQHRAVMEKARQEMKVVKEALKEELMKSQLDMSKVKTLHGQVKDLLSQMEDTKLASILAVRAILSPEQFTKFVSLMHKHKQEHAQ